MSMMTSDEEFDSMVDKSHPPVPVVVYVVDCFLYANFFLLVFFACLALALALEN
ncbi:hypothetical protein D3C80_2029280 [compost metagenome]